jgi:hypothetical protein
MHMLAVVLATAAAATAITPMAPSAQVHAQRPGAPGAQPPGRPPLRRDALEAQVLTRFAKRASDEMALDGTQRTRLAEVIRSTSTRRKQLNQRSMEMHKRFMQAIRDQATTPEAFTKLLADQQALRHEEQQIADSEMTELQRFLTPRQQAHFLMLWIRLQDNARQIQSQMPNGRGGGLPE